MSDVFLILNAAQAVGIAGPTADGAELTPIALADGATFILPIAVLSDPAHSMRYEALDMLPQREVQPDEWPPRQEIV